MRGASRKPVGNEFMNPLISLPKDLKVNPIYGNTKNKTRGATLAPVATMISKTNKKNEKTGDTENEEKKEHDVKRALVQYYYDYDEDGDIFYYRVDGTGDSVWDLPEGAVWIEKEDSS